MNSLPIKQAEDSGIMSLLPPGTRSILFKGVYLLKTSSKPCPDVGVYLKFSNGAIGGTTHSILYSSALLESTPIYTIEKTPSYDIMLTNEYENIITFCGEEGSRWGWYIAEIEELDEGWRITKIHPAFFDKFKKIKYEYVVAASQSKK